MPGNYPVDGPIRVLKDAESLGPFSVDEILDHLESGELQPDDVCLREGALECERLRDILDWDTEETAPSQQRSEPADEPSSDSEAIPGGPARVDAVLYHGHPSILTNPLALLGLVGGVVGGAWLYAIDGRFTVVCLLVALLSLAFLSLMRYLREYQITPRRVEQTTGLIARSSQEVRIDDIRAINAVCRGLPGMIGVGTVDFFTTGDDPEVSFRGVWAARRVKTLVRRIQDGAFP